MKLSIRAGGSAEAASSSHAIRGMDIRLWVLVTDERGEPLSSECRLRCLVRDTRFVRWMKCIRIWPSTRRKPRPLRLEVTRPNPALPEFLVTGRPGRFLPYWLEFHAIRDGNDHERTRLFVAPIWNRLLSLVFGVAFVLLLAYSSWLWLTLESPPQGFTTIAATTSAVLAPFAAFISPLFSATVRRLTVDALASGAAALGALILTALLFHLQSPVYIENNTPSEINALLLGKQVVIQPGGAVVVPVAPTSPDAQETRSPDAQGLRESLRRHDWFRKGEYCFYDFDENCLELRPATLFTKLQRLLAFGEKALIGCNALPHMDVDTIEAWKNSGSCRHDPNIQLTRSFHEHLVRTDLRKGDPTPCAEPAGQVVINPFRQAATPGQSSLTPSVIPLSWELQGPFYETIPNFRFVSNGPLSELKLAPSLTQHGKPCELPYPTPCNPARDKPCPGLYVPPNAELSATIRLGEQDNGNLWCAYPPGRVLAVRLKSRIVGLRVLDGDRELSRFEAPAQQPAGWAFWCEPATDTTAPTDGTKPTGTLTAEVSLARDWQPTGDWKWTIPPESRVGLLTISLQEHGRWGTIECAPTSEKRELSLTHVTQTQREPIRSVKQPGMTWTRYPDTPLFPNWVWLCTSGESGTGNLQAELESGKHGTLQAGRFVPTGAPACVLDPLSGRKIPGQPRVGQGGGASKDFGPLFVAQGCDPQRSVFASAQGMR